MKDPKILQNIIKLIYTYCIFCLLFINCNCVNKIIELNSQCLNPNDYFTITANDITWYFDKEYECGQFANGDYWVVRPSGESVNISGIYPESTINRITGKVINGSMLNPAVNSGNQGFDQGPNDFPYSSTLNVAFGISPNNPLAIGSDASLISTISKNYSSENHSYVKSAEVLTVLSAAPASGSFRPPYVGTDKTISHNISELDYSVLESLAQVADTYDLSTVEDMFRGVWLEFNTNPQCSSIHPSDNMPWYGREIAMNVGIGALMLHLNFTNVQKENLLIYYTQLGLDLYRIIQLGGSWIPNGGHESGRKWPILFAGIMLNDAGMKAIGDKSGDYLYSGVYYEGNRPPDYIDFGEDGQTFYVTSRDIIREHDRDYQYNLRPGYVYPMADVDYIAADLDIPEWGINHSHTPAQDSTDWDTNYRAATGSAFTGFVLAALIMEDGASAKTLWNHNALFDYQYRYMALENSIDNFTTNMWDTYINDYYPAP